MMNEICFRLVIDYNRQYPLDEAVEVKTTSFYDQYDVLEEIGVGAFGVVHRVVERATGNVFAPKFVNTPAPVDKHTVRQEIHVMNQLHHSKLLRLHDAFDMD